MPMGSQALMKRPPLAENWVRAGSFRPYRSLHVRGDKGPAVKAVAQAVGEAVGHPVLVGDVILHRGTYPDADGLVQAEALGLEVVVPILVGSEEPAVVALLRQAVDLRVLVIPEAVGGPPGI
jgi:hypothetical protein